MGAMATTAVDVVVTGRVQGVFFRASMREQAELLGVAGWVRNEPDGSVRAHLEGDADAVDSLVAWCSHGPPAAIVQDVRRTPGDPTGTTAFKSD
jgi:acylphosphatase